MKNIKNQAIALTLLLVAPIALHAQDRRDDHRDDRSEEHHEMEHREEHLDNRVHPVHPVIRNEYREYHHGNQSFFYRNGFYYRHDGDRYIVAHPPRGFIIDVLPPLYTRVYVGNNWYFRYGDIWYQQVPTGYEVVDAPMNAPVESNEGYETVLLNNVVYEVRDGQFFQQTPQGLVAVAAPLGAYIHSVPEGAHTFWANDREYFEVNGAVYKKTQHGYKVVPALVH